MTRLAGCIIRSDNSILLLHRNTAHSVQWELPGGKIEDETAEQAARREVLEELGVTVGSMQYVGEAKFGHHPNAFHYTWYEAVITSGVPTPLEALFDAVRFVPISELESLQLSANMQKLLPILLSMNVHQSTAS